MRNFKFRFSRERFVGLSIGFLVASLHFASAPDAAAQSSVREINTKRQLPSFLTRPFAVLAGDSREADTVDTGTSELVDDAFFTQYETQLNAILKTRLDEEKEFVEAVVEQVQAGNISTRLVNTSFKWVRNKRPNVKNSFVYFERVLRILASSQGVGEFIPDFDANVYSSTVTGVPR
jgi:hypothetical protein